MWSFSERGGLWRNSQQSESGLLTRPTGLPSRGPRWEIREPGFAAPEPAGLVGNPPAPTVLPTGPTLPLPCPHPWASGFSSLANHSLPVAPG